MVDKSHFFVSCPSFIKKKECVLLIEICGDFFFLFQLVILCNADNYLLFFFYFPMELRISHNWFYWKWESHCTISEMYITEERQAKGKMYFHDEACGIVE